MKIYEIKSFVFLMLSIAFIIEAFLTRNAIDSQLFASLGIISGAMLSKIISNKNAKPNEKY